jgi:multiple sugar transport system permease protein
MNQIYILLGYPLGEIEANPNANPMALLNACAKDVNAKLTGYVDPKVMHQRRMGAWALFGVIVVLGGFFFVRYFTTLMKQLFSSFSSESSATAGVRTRPIAHIIAWFFMVPAVLSILIWSYYPLMRGLVIAFQNYQIIRPPHWVGLDNFIEAMFSASFWNGLWVALRYTLYTLAFGFFLPIFLALGLSEIPRLKMLFRTLYYLPAVTSGLIIAFMWKQFYDSTKTGLFNHLLSMASAGHIQPIHWLDDPHIALISVVLPSIWAAAGPGCIVYLAALKGVDEEMYEAADLDGAGIWTKIWKVTMPTLKPLVLINLVGATIGAFKASDQILVLTGGGPIDATTTIGLNVFYNAFLYLKFGYATAVAWIMGALLIGFTLWQLRMLKDLKFSAARA